MDYYAGIDVSLEQSSVCVVDSSGKIVRETKVASEPEALLQHFADLGLLPLRRLPPDYRSRLPLQSAPRRDVHPSRSSARVPPALSSVRKECLACQKDRRPNVLPSDDPMGLCRCSYVALPHRAVTTPEHKNQDSPELAGGSLISRSGRSLLPTWPRPSRCVWPDRPGSRHRNVLRAKQRDDGFRPLLGDNRNLLRALLDVDDCIRRIALRKRRPAQWRVLLPLLTCARKGHGIECRRSFSGHGGHSNLPRVPEQSGTVEA